MIRLILALLIIATAAVIVSCGAVAPTSPIKAHVVAVTDSTVALARDDYHGPTIIIKTDP